MSIENLILISYIKTGNSISSATPPSLMPPPVLPMCQSSPAMSTLSDPLKSKPSNLTTNDNVVPSFAKPSSTLSASSMSSANFLLPTNSSLNNIQLPTQPLDISEVNEFSSKNTLSCKPPPNVTSTLENIVTSKPSTVSLLRGMRLKKSLQSKGSKSDVNNDSLKTQNDKEEKDGDKKLFVRPFEDGYTCGSKTKLNAEPKYENMDNSYTPPEFNITERSLLGDINVSIPVTLESNLKHINGRNFLDREQAMIYNEMSNNNNTVISSQVSLKTK